MRWIAAMSLLMVLALALSGPALAQELRVFENKELRVFDNIEPSAPPVQGIVPSSGGATPPAAPMPVTRLDDRGVR